MRSWKYIVRRSAIVISLLAVCSAFALCQQGTPNSSGDSKPAQARNQPTKGQSAQNDNNAFPLAQSEAAAKADAQRKAQQDADSRSKAASGKTASSEKTAPSNAAKSATAKDNPFPEGQSEAAAKKDARNGTEPAANKEANPSASAAGYSSSNAHLPPQEVGQGSLGSHEKLDTFTRDQTQDGRIRDDLNVADLYMKNGNYRGALLRYQDALNYDPQNDTALYGVAYSMCKQNLTGNAMARFKSYVKNNPQGKYALKAEKMLAHPNKCMHNF